uniref:ADAMTS/ADAMTS-like Spacer 1 domain-containing protein n=1 Tax=Hucho hucho TaxID=62062 RepID=A0A4W5KVH0_9TELE
MLTTSCVLDFVKWSTYCLQKIGCDGIIGSSAREDRCGVCNGDGHSCKIVKGDFNHTKGRGYIEAAVIPVGARRIKVVEDKPSHSFL